MIAELDGGAIFAVASGIAGVVMFVALIWAMFKYSDINRQKPEPEREPDDLPAKPPD